MPHIPSMILFMNSAPDHTSCIEKQNKLLKEFEKCTSSEAVYEKLIEMGRSFPHASEDQFTESCIVPGCQSKMLLKSKLLDNKLTFSIYSDALISRGLAALLLEIYSGEPPEVILTCKPEVLEKLKLLESLTPGRVNGLASLLTRMKQEALTVLTQK